MADARIIVGDCRAGLAMMGSEDWAREDVPFDCAQHATRADAEAGHALIVARVRGLPHPLRGRR